MTLLNQTGQDDAFDGALAVALAAMRRDGDARPAWSDAIARRDHSSPTASDRAFLQAPRALKLIDRRSIGLAPAEKAITAAARASLSYWARLGEGHAPLRRLCAPAIDRPLLAPWLFIGVLTGGGGLAIELSGEAVDDFADRPLAGARLAHLAANRPEEEAFADCLKMLEATGGPTLIRGVAQYDGDRRQMYELAFAPLRDDDGAPTVVLGALGLDVLREPDFHAAS